MAQSAVAEERAVPRPAPLSIPVRDIVPWAVFAAVLGLVLIYFVGAEQGATSLLSGTWVHEFTHDGRHLLGFPCH
ncbi:CbtB-domain containing protein [Actinomadura logoneensis]|uniref:CbtB-domain containing protein n=1 Tax=Actinomadura logoneensis TaxID=2293572 RepID=A0A372JI09_9ACTN|nr:CbtB domain-containing protein [Actinomadura logoneensis]RFU39662.1 CbtB-domain containing protein [Actinomadura logoneensis]